MVKYYIHQITCFRLIKVSYLSPRGGERALEFPIFLLWGKDRRIKVRICANGSVQRAWIQKEGTAIPTAYQ